MGAQGQTVIAFGTGTNYATAVVTGQGSIGTGSLVEGWVSITASGATTADDCINECLIVRAGNISAGVGFTIYVNVDRGYAHGNYTINWVWN
jgi:hypothetical protein